MLDAGNYFELFGLPVKFALDGDELKRRHLALQQQLHPDRHMNALPAQRQLAEQLAASCNEGYRVLTDALARAAYVLRLRGHDPFAEGDRNTMPVDFLERQLELREQLEDISAARDAPAARELATRLARETEQEFAALGANLDGAGDPAPAVAATRRLKYLLNCQQEAQRLADG